MVYTLYNYKLYRLTIKIYMHMYVLIILAYK